MKKPSFTLFPHATPPAWYKAPADPVAPPAWVLTIPETAAAIGLGLTTTRALLKSGELPSIMLHRRRVIKRESVDAFLAKREAGNSGRRK